MNREEFLRDEADLIALVGSLGGPTLESVALKVAYAREVLAKMPSGVALPWDRVLGILEDLKLSLSEREAEELLLASGLAKEGKDGLQLPTDISMDRVFPELAAGGLELARDRFLRLLVGKHDAGVPEVRFPDLQACLAAIDRTSYWAIEVADRVRSGQLPGIPVFWTCEGDLHSPFSPDPGTLATTDTLLLVFERLRYGAPVPDLDLKQRRAVLWLYERVLALQRHKNKWDRGSFSVPTWDDDFVGTYLDIYRELGPCPTVDASGNAVVALSAALRSGFPCLLEQGQSEQLERVAREAIRLGVEFLLRCQTGNGGWPIYRYKDDRFRMPERDISSKFAIEGLAEATMSGVLDSSLGELVRRAATGYFHLLKRTVHRDDEECYWVPNFARPFAREHEKIQATATIGSTLEAMTRAWPEFEDEIMVLREGAKRFLERVWEPNPCGYVRIAFRVPTWEGPADTRVPWEWPGDPMVVSTLLKADAAGSRLEPSTCGRISGAVASFVDLEMHGHWVDFLMKKEGKDRAMPGNTLHYHRAILDYVAWQARLLNRLFGIAGSGQGKV